jgi:hypothetical protein
MFSITLKYEDIMKKLLIGLLVLSTFSAQANCVSRMLNKKKENASVLAGTSLISAPAIAVAPFTGGLSLIIPGVLVGTYGIKLGVKTKRVNHLIEIVEQSKKCDGKEINKLYKKYARVSNIIISMSDFCYQIDKGNETGDLCKSLNSVKKKDIIKFIDL